VTAGIEDRLRRHFSDIEDREGTLVTPDPARVTARAPAGRRPRRAPVVAGWRPRRRLLVVGGLAAAGLAVTALVVATAPRHGRVDIDRPATTAVPTTPVPTTPVPTTPAPTTPAPTTIPRPPGTGSTTPPTPGRAQAVTVAELRGLRIPFSAGRAAMPAPCREYWKAYNPADQGLGPADNTIDVDSTAQGSPDADHDGVPDTLALADVDGDGVTDGLAVFTCETRGVLPPTGVLVLLARDRSVVTTGWDELTAAARAAFGDERFGFVPPVAWSAGTVTAGVAGWERSAPDCCPTLHAAATFRIQGGALHLVRFEKKDG